jgi:hypothetical protein
VLAVAKVAFMARLCLKLESNEHIVWDVKKAVKRFLHYFLLFFAAFFCAASFLRIGHLAKTPGAGPPRPMPVK